MKQRTSVTACHGGQQLAKYHAM